MTHDQERFRDHYEQIRRQLTSLHPVDVASSSLALPQSETAPFIASVRPILDGPASRFNGAWSPSELPPLSDEFIGTYIRLDEYLSELAAMPLESLADEHRRESLLTAVVGLNRVRNDEPQLELLTNALIEALPEPASARLRAALGTPTGGLGRRLIAAQPLLLAMRWLIGHPISSQPMEDATSWLHAVLFVQAVANTTFTAGRLDDDEPDLPLLSIVMTNLAGFDEHDDVLGALDRTLRLWIDYGDETRTQLGHSASELLQLAVGLDVQDILGFGFALLAHSITWKPGDPVAIDRQIHPGLRPELREAGLRVLCAELNDCLQSLGDPESEFDVLAIEQHPVIGVGGNLLVLDAQLLWRRCTSGLFWIVHDSLRSSSEKAVQDFRIAFGRMVERLVEDQFELMAPRDLAGARTYFTETDLGNAFGGRVCDCVVDYGDALLLVEIVSGRISVPTRVHVDLAKLKSDLDRLVFSKCEQLDASGHRLLDDEEPLTGVPRGRRTPPIVPVLVVGGGFPVNAATQALIREQLVSSGLLTHPRFQPLSVLGLQDVELLEGLNESGVTPVTVLRGWHRSAYRAGPLRNYVIRHFPTIPRAVRFEESARLTFDLIRQRLGIEEEPDVPTTG